MSALMGRYTMVKEEKYALETVREGHFSFFEFLDLHESIYFYFAYVKHRNCPPDKNFLVSIQPLWLRWIYWEGYSEAIARIIYNNTCLLPPNPYPFSEKSPSGCLKKY